MRDLNKLSKEIYRANKAKGFHEESHSPEHLFCLVISELMEAVEADRKGRTFNQIGCTNDFEHFYRDESKLGFEKAFELNIKDTVSDELADAVIRLLDTAGALDVTISTPSDGFVFQPCHNLFTENIYDIISNLFGYIAPFAISVSICAIEGICSKLNIDLWQHVELKLRYNGLRPYKHGKKY